MGLVDRNRLGEGNLGLGRLSKQLFFSKALYSSIQHLFLQRMIFISPLRFYHQTRFHLRYDSFFNPAFTDTIIVQHTIIVITITAIILVLTVIFCTLSAVCHFGYEKTKID